MGMAELDKSVDFDYTSVELTDRLIQCAQHALPYFSTQVGSSPFILVIRIHFLRIRIRARNLNPDPSSRIANKKSFVRKFEN